MQQRALWGASLVAAALADVAGEPRLGFYLVLVAIPLGAGAALRALAALIDEEGGLLGARAVLAGVTLAFVVAAAAVRAPFVAEGTVPPLSSSALIGALVLLSVDGIAAQLHFVFLKHKAEPLADRAY